jgi:ribosomal protein S18 acetylase RimI-like enzyme
MREDVAMTNASAEPGLRSLEAHDLERIVAIDREHTGRSRRHFFERRFEAAKSQPDGYVQIGVGVGRSLRGYAMARVLRGEFGREHVTAVLDAIGVEPASRELGVGQVLMDALIAALRARGVRSLQSQADWTNPALLRFFRNSGFELAPRLVLERSVTEPLAESVAEI